MGHSNLLEKPGRLMLAEQHKTYQWVQNNGRGYLQLPLLNHPEVFHLFGSRLLSAEALENRFQPIRIQQVHGQHIHDLTTDQDWSLLKDVTGDGLITVSPNRLISIGTADCAPILLLDPTKRVCAAIHAGWRGSVSDITGNAVRKMRAEYGSDPADIFAGIGPTINACCFEVGTDVVEAISEKTPYRDEDIFYQGKGQEAAEKWQMNLVRLNRLQLMDAGLPPHQIEAAGLCTHCLPNLFYSYRRDKKKLGNMISGIMLL